MKKMFALALALSALMVIPSFGQVYRTNTVTFRPGAKVKLVSATYQNPNSSPSGQTVLLLAGLAHNGNTMVPLVQAAMADPSLKSKIRRLVILDFPGHGRSSLPFGSAGLLYGQVSLDDYATCLIEALDIMKDADSPAATIVAHSMAGLVVQVAQEKLLKKGSRLASKGVKRVLALGSSNPGDVPDPVLEDGFGLYLLSIFGYTDPVLGDVAQLDSGSFQSFFFTDLNSIPVAGAPTPEQIDAAGYIAVESGAASLQTLGTADLRPHVRQNAFAICQGTKAFLFAGENDSLTVFGGPSLYDYLTGGTTGSYNVMLGPWTCHDSHIVNPAGVLANIKAALTSN